MFAYEEIVYQPAFYFLVAFTLVLTFGYTWGRRLNRRVLMSALDPLLEVLRSRDQQFTNIGGQSGYHATIVPGTMRGVRRVDATVTLLPRQSLLYMPVSLLTRRFDRMQMLFMYNKRGKQITDEAHLIEARFSRMAGNRIENADTLHHDRVEWGNRTFLRYWSSDRAQKWLDDIQKRLEVPGVVRHVALVPDQEQAYLFLVPRIGTVSPTVSVVRDWLDTVTEEAAQ